MHVLKNLYSPATYIYNRVECTERCACPSTGFNTAQARLVKCVLGLRQEERGTFTGTARKFYELHTSLDCLVKQRIEWWCFPKCT